MAGRGWRRLGEDFEAPGRYRVTLTGLICAMFAVMLFYVGASQILHRPSTQQAMVAAEATVVKSGQRRFSPRTEGPYVEIRYDLPDGSRVMTDLNRVELAEGAKLRIRYDPKQPRQVVIDDDDRAYLAAAGAFAFGILFVAGACFASRPRRGPVR